MREVLALIIGCALSACAAEQARPVVEVEAAPTGAWETIIRPEDRTRLTTLPATWLSAWTRAESRSAALLKDVADIARPDAALDHPALPPGSYNCSLTRMGDFGARRPAVRRFPPFFCYVRGEEGNALSFTKQTGTDLPGGWLHPDVEAPRYVFLGAKQRKPGDNSLSYGTELERDLAGVLERIGPFRWRLVVPWRDGDTGIDIYELTPVPADGQAEEPPAG
jgi:hypothetical protein